MMMAATLRMWLLIPPFFALAAVADEPAKSLLFSPAESAAIVKAMGDLERMNTTGQAVEEAAPPEGPNIYVSAIADYGDGLWTVWANGYRISPDHQHPLFRVMAVSGDLAEIQVSEGKQERFLLRSRQTWLSRSHSIVEGIVP